MLTKTHIELLLKKARTGEEIDLTSEIEKLPKATWFVSEDIKEFLLSTGTIYNADEGSCLVYNSQLIKLEINTGFIMFNNELSFKKY